jgi:hypothetical protein
LKKKMFEIDGIAFQRLTDFIGIDEIGIDEIPGRFIGLIIRLICQPNGGVPEICSNILDLFSGFSRSQLNMTLLATIVSHGVSSSSGARFTNL